VLKLEKWIFLAASNLNRDGSESLSLLIESHWVISLAFTSNLPRQQFQPSSTSPQAYPHFSEKTPVLLGCYKLGKTRKTLKENSSVRPKFLKELQILKALRLL
jgi:hypothetical protein